MVSGRHVVIEVSASRLIAAVVTRGQVVDFRMAPVEFPDWASSWPQPLAELQVPLAEMVESMSARGLHATVVYDGPAAAAAAFACPAVAGESAAELAAVLALGEQLSYRILEHQSDAQVLCTECPRRSRAPGTIGGGGRAAPIGAIRTAATGGVGGIGRAPAAAPTPNRHTLAIADTLDSADAVTAWVRGAGLRPVSLLPSAAPPLALLVTAVTGGTTPGVRAALWFGEHVSILAAGEAGSLRFIRVLRLGTEALVEALLRPVRRAGPTGEQVLLERTEARRLTTSRGVPAPDQVFSGEYGLLGSAVLPMLQPVIQRFALELKQSMRFGLSEDERAGVRVVLDGPGSLLPRMAEVLSQQSGLTVGVGAPRASAGVAGSPEDLEASARRLAWVLGAPGEETAVAWGALEGLAANLAPQEIGQAMALSSARKSVWGGVGAALALIGLYAGATVWSLEQSRAEADRLRADARAAEAASGRQAATIRSIEQSAMTVQRIRTELGFSTDWSAVLALLAESTPELVRLSSVELLTKDNGEPAVQLVGVVKTDKGSDAAMTLREFAERLSSRPIARSVRLGATQRTQLRGEESQRFEMSIVLAPTPVLPMLPDFDAGGIADGGAAAGGTGAGLGLGPGPGPGETR